jgi:hypothetical protein
MKKRLYTAIGYVLGAVFILLVLCSAPIWLIIWVLTGYNPIEVLSEKVNPRQKARIAKINEETEKILAETERIKQELEEIQRQNEETERLKRSN